ncbi:MAG: DUF308 domain-containing protein [Methanoregulaceae archaeon]|jgi:uncharacterized membrane protein HdeD (DUF308 family)|nr:DUF308 domain-containing protein [Methanoregulaceae archaeon]
MVFVCRMNPGGSWRFPVALGILGVVIGVLLILFPEQAIRITIYLFGLVAIIIAVILFAIAYGMSRGGGAVAAVPAIIGIVFLIFGLVSFVNPGIIGAFMAVLFSILAIIAGFGLLFSSVFTVRPAAMKILVAAGGIFLAAIGISILFSTQATSLFIVQLAGAFFIASGVISLVGALLMRGGRQEEMTYQRLDEWDGEGP